MRVGIDAHILTGKHQGSRSWLVNVVDHAAVQDSDIMYVIYSFEPNTARMVLHADNIEHRLLPIRPAIPRLLFYWPYAMLAHRLDALVTQYISPPFASRPQIVVIHDVLFETHPYLFSPFLRWRLRLLTRLAALRANAILTVSEYSQRQIARVYEISQDRICVVPNAAPTAVLAGTLPDQIEPGLPFILFVGRIEPRKNLTLLLKAFDQIPDSNVRLVMVGHVERSGRRDIAAAMQERRAIYLGQVDDKALFALYHAAAALVLPSLGEGFGIPVLEALACGCPVIAAMTTGLIEAGGNVASYFDPLAPDAADQLAGLIMKALAGQLAIDSMILKDHLSQFSWTRSAQAFVRTVGGIRVRD
jgi:glycosyltransferase involved in cell wall biosynthesis